MKEATLVEIMKFFGMSSGEFAQEWKQLDNEDKQYFRTAVGEEVDK